MTQEPKRSRRGGQPKAPAARKRNNLTFRTRDDLRERLERAAGQSNRSVSEEIEFRLLRDFGWEATKGDINEMREQAAAALSAAQVQMVRLAGFQILREIEGRPKRVVIDYDTLLAEADGVARGLRSGFTPDAAPKTPMTAEEERRLLAELENLKQQVSDAIARTRAKDEPNAARQG